MEDRETITFGHVKVFLFGGLVGAAVALLFAPKSGREMRGELKDRAGRFKTSATENWQNISSKGKEIVDTVASRGREAYEKGAEAVSEHKERVGAALAAGSAAAKEAYRKKDSSDQAGA